VTAVFNSSPWIFLSKLGLLKQALELFDRVLLPSSVKEEISARKDEAYEALQEVQGVKQVEIVTTSNVRFVAGLRRRLGKGEAEAIVIALEKNADIVVLDDHTARSEARRLGLRVKGTLGIIRRMMELGIVNIEVNELYERLRKMGFRIKKDLFWEIFKE